MVERFSSQMSKPAGDCSGETAAEWPCHTLRRPASQPDAALQRAGKTSLWYLRRRRKRAL